MTGPPYGAHNSDASPHCNDDTDVRHRRCKCLWDMSDGICNSDILKCQTPGAHMLEGVIGGS